MSEEKKRLVDEEEDEDDDIPDLESVASSEVSLAILLLKHTPCALCPSIMTLMTIAL